MSSISVVIPSWDGAEHLRRTLPPLLAQEKVSYEVIVVDNGSGNEDTKKLVQELQKEHKQLRLITLKRNAGFTGAVNVGAQEAKFPLVAVLGNDNLVEPEWLDSLLERWGNGICPDTGKMIGAVMSQTIVNHQIPYGPCTLNLFGRNIFYPDDEWVNDDFFTFYPGGNSFLYDKSSYDLPYTELYFTYHEDVSLGWRIQNQGSVVVQTHHPYVHSFDGGTTRRKSARFKSLMLTERNRWLNLLTFPENATLVKLSWLWILDILFSLVKGPNRIAKLTALLWLSRNIKLIQSLRDRRQSDRRVSDREAFRYMSPDYFSTAEDSFSFSGRTKVFINKIFRFYWKIVGLPVGSGLRSNSRNES